MFKTAAFSELRFSGQLPEGIVFGFFLRTRLCLFHALNVFSNNALILFSSSGGLLQPYFPWGRDVCKIMSKQQCSRSGVSQSSRTHFYPRRLQLFTVLMAIKCISKVDGNRRTSIVLIQFSPFSFQMLSNTISTTFFNHAQTSIVDTLRFECRVLFDVRASPGDNVDALP